MTDERLAARVRELEAERDDYVRYASKFAEERDALQDELRGCMGNFDDACTTLARVES
jgi:FtsZ-binding cell division protein ZapB